MLMRQRPMVLERLRDLPSIICSHICTIYALVTLQPPLATLQLQLAPLQ